MPHETTHVIRDSLIEIFTNDAEYPGVREHFTAAQLQRLDDMADQDAFSAGDKFFLWRMLGKLLRTAA